MSDRETHLERFRALMTDEQAESLMQQIEAVPTCAIDLEEPDAETQTRHNAAGETP